MVASLSSEAAGLRSAFFKPSGKPSTSRTPSSGKVRRIAPCRSSRSLSPLQKCRPLRSRHLFRGRAERRDCFLRRLRSFLTPALRAQTRTAESLRSLLCRAWMLQGLRCVRCGCEFYAESAETCGLVILACSDLSAYTTSPKSLPPAQPSRAKMVNIVLSFVVLC